MDKLWAPWRSKFIYLRKHKKCIFCGHRSHDKTKDKKSYILTRTRLSFAMLNLYPYNNGHVMVAPFRHVKSLEMLSDAELIDLMKLVTKMKVRVDNAFHPHGQNVGINLGKVAGAGFAAHLHIHIVPRWNGDCNFMPVIADTKIVSESLDAVYKLLSD